MKKPYTQDEWDAVGRVLAQSVKPYVVGTDWKGVPVTPEQETDTHTVTCPRCAKMFKVDLEDLHEGCE